MHWIYWPNFTISNVLLLVYFAIINIKILFSYPLWRSIEVQSHSSDARHDFVNFKTSINPIYIQLFPSEVKDRNKIARRSSKKIVTYSFYYYYYYHCWDAVFFLFFLHFTQWSWTQFWFELNWRALNFTFTDFNGGKKIKMKTKIE